MDEKTLRLKSNVKANSPFCAVLPSPDRTLEWTDENDMKPNVTSPAVALPSGDHRTRSERLFDNVKPGDRVSAIGRNPIFAVAKKKISYAGVSVEMPTAAVVDELGSTLSLRCTCEPKLHSQANVSDPPDRFIVPRAVAILGDLPAIDAYRLRCKWDGHRAASL